MSSVAAFEVRGDDIGGRTPVDSPVRILVRQKQRQDANNTKYAACDLLPRNQGTVRPRLGETLRFSTYIKYTVGSLY